jgi:hypothetical protein
MSVLRRIFDRLPWTRLMPAPGLLAEQPGEADPARFVAAAQASDGTMVIYSPAGGVVRFTGSVAGRTPMVLVDPRTGETEGPAPLHDGAVALPDEHDWLLISEPGGKALARA